MTSCGGSIENCALFCFLSLGEGYGLPPVEAAYFGARVLVSDIPVFRENLGGAAEYVDPNDVSAISNAITDLLAPARYERGYHDAAGCGMSNNRGLGLHRGNHQNWHRGTSRQHVVPTASL